jgi:DNA-binding transcriptional ArsR family regulator
LTLAKQKAKAKPPNQMRLAKAIALVVRVDILRILHEREASPKELAAMLDENLSYVSYHIRQLLKYHCIEEVRTEQRRGALEHFYRSTTWPFVSDVEAAKQSRETREEISTRVLQVMFSEAAGALESGSFDSRVDRHLSWMPMPLGEEGVRESLDLMLETLERLQQIAEADAERRDGSGEETEEFIFAMMGFERSDSPARFDREGKPLS